MRAFIPRMGARHRIRGCLRASPFLALATLLACSAPPSPSPSPSPSLPAMVGWPALQVVERLDVPMHGDALPAGITSWEGLVVRSADLEVVGVDARGRTPVLVCRSDGTAELRFSRDGVDVAYA